MSDRKKTGANSKKALPDQAERIKQMNRLLDDAVAKLKKENWKPLKKVISIDPKDKETQNRALELLKSSLDDNEAEFRNNQWEVISFLVIEKLKVLVVEKTGWGKSSLYFISTKLLRDRGFGPTIIISPLIALMRNQIQSAASFDVALGTINSSQTPDENSSTRNKLHNDKLDALIISPEQLANQDIIEDVIKPISSKCGLLVVDEAHCISDWGHDFRPDYKRIRTILSFLPTNIPVLLTTATANTRVTEDIVSQLGDEGIYKIRGPLTRRSLHLQCISFPKRSQRLAWLAETLPKLDGTGIIYTATVRAAIQVEKWLISRGLNVRAYYGNSPDRLELEQDLLENNIDALVATSALGMGYDKPDLAFVIHYQSPGSVVNYYQQVGRAGRAIDKAYGVLLSGDEDDHIQNYFIDQAFPKENLVNVVLDAIESSENGLKLYQIIARVNARKNKIEHVLKFLRNESPAPIMQNQEKTYSRTLIDYELPHETIKRLSERKLKEWNRMQDYLHSKDCLMQFLAEELDDKDPEPCGKCENCAPEKALSTEYSENIAIEAAKFLQNIDIQIKPKKRAGSSNDDARWRFPIYQLPYSLAKDGLMHEYGRVLCYWGDAGWGEMSKEGKEKYKAFDTRLVSASAKLIKEKWKPESFPSWLTFVPSNRSELVANFADELANALGIKFFDVVKKIKHNKPQKKMENANYRCKNLDGVFEISANIPKGSVLLVDDIYDSGWTFAVISALLRRSGSDKVFPFAVASTSNN